MKLIILIYKFFLSRRYKVEIKNAEILKHNWPVLLLPNHVALIDPQILMTFLDKYLRLSPVASEKFFLVPVLKQVMQMFGTIPIWEMSEWADEEKVKAVFGKVVEAMKQWKNILIYPSGEIYKQGFESIIWKQAVYNIAQNMPENTKVVWLRQRGLWGSMWSKAWDNGKTWFFSLLLKGIFIVFANLIFFVPKRKVSIELEDITDQINLYKNMSLWEFNKYLENFYNKIPLSQPFPQREKGDKEENNKITHPSPLLDNRGNNNEEEKANFIKHYFYYNDVKNKKEPEIITWSLKDLQNSKKLDLSEIPEKIKKDIFDKIASIKEMTSPQHSPQGEGEKSISENSNLILDLFFDSLDMAEIKSYIQAKYPQSSNPPITDLKTTWDLLIMAVW